MEPRGTRRSCSNGWPSRLRSEWTWNSSRPLRNTPFSFPGGCNERNRVVSSRSKLGLVNSHSIGPVANSRAWPAAGPRADSESGTAFLTGAASMG
jgi:hypothetical protein